jgi:hypothetical protein
MVGGEVDEPVLIRPLSAALTTPVVVIESVRLFYKPEVDKDVDVADNGSSRDAAGIGDSLVAGEALIGFAIAVGEDDMERPPDRSTDQGEVAFGQLLKYDQRILFLLARLGFGRASIVTA